MRMASIHHHFPKTEALRNALKDSDSQQFTRELERRFNSTRCIELFVGGLSDELTPLHTAHAGDAASPPASLKNSNRFFVRESQSNLIC
jgi:hypothetical protein